ncbi:ATP-dependent helicase [Xylanibacter muris]|uniref:DNA 3'-5' helicase n=1 Tax=Xylanibacter muris TaxID=2736290 RepID=A0ABX2AQM2_9BACT|nr:UvrD-helicase domain-containing protein [Xylanibacter muris]NPD93015.1 UvrD-helicase domain-containing protein [Xylanibacter muris]
MTEDILKRLNGAQREAVLYCDGAQLVIAGAGSGKTRVLTYKIAYLLKNGLEPWNILALTFTNKAARAMKERIGQVVGEHIARCLNMGTFHSVFSKILRSEATHIGYTSGFTIYDQGDSRSLVKNIIKDMKLDDKVYKPSSVADRISMAKNQLLLPAAYANSAETVMTDVQRKMPAIKDIYLRYSERCRQANAMDFDDLLVNTYTLFNTNEEIRLKYVDRFRYVLVDEYQDTNRVQQAIVMLLTKDNQRVCVVGDDAQSIYSFRGANIDNILNFTKFYDNARLFKLEQNYRSTQNIVRAANSLIRHNRYQIPKDVFSEKEHGEKLVLKPAYSDKEEALIVCRDIQKIRRTDKCEYSDFAILYRTNSQSRSFEEYMRKQNIPYRIYGGLSFYQRKEIKDVIAYFRMVVNPDDEEALRRIINYPARGIGDTTLGKIAGAANANNVSLWEVICRPDVYGLSISKGTMGKLSGFRSQVSQWIERVVATDAYTLGRDIIKESGIYRDIYKGQDPEDLARQENIDEFLGGMKDFVDTRMEEDQTAYVMLGDFLQEVSLLTDLDSDTDDNQPKVSLMTVHSAKGLEFPTVFVVGLEENIFPSPMSCNSIRELEEERRLLYVAITRAEKHCILTCAQNRFRYGRIEYDTPSRFINDIDRSLLNIEGQGGVSKMFNGYDGGQRKEWMQNPHPVASQFKADPKPRIVPVRKESPAPEVFSESFKRDLNAASARNMKRVSEVTVADKTDISLQPSQTDVRKDGVAVGNIIEHQRFGIGVIKHVEGNGENAKATVEFKNAGTKQLLLKFARFTIVK